MIPQTAARTPPSAGVDPLTGIAYSEDTTDTYLYSSEITTLNYLTYGCYLPINGEFYESLALENPTPVINDDGTEGDPITNDFGTDRDKILYCGGYLCSTWLTQEKFTWVKNEKYWDADNIFITKVDYIVSEGLMNIHPEMSKEERTQKVSQALLEVGLLPEFASRFPHEFSGGQRQRIGIARSLIMEPEFIIADEPISALDVSIRAQVLNLLSRLQKERGLTYLFIAHDLSVMRFICDRIAVIHKGVIVELAEAEQLLAHPLHPYTRRCCPPSPCPIPSRRRRKCWRSTTPPSITTTPTSPPGPRSSPAISSWPTRKSLPSTRPSWRSKSDTRIFIESPFWQPPKGAFFMRLPAFSENA